MTADDARLRIAALSAEIDRHNRLYHLDASNEGFQDIFY